MKSAIVLIGFSSMISQLLLFRELNVVYNSNELMLGIALSTWFFWIGIGSIYAKKLRNSPQIFYYLVFLAPIVLFVQLIIVRISKPLLGIGYGELTAILPSFYITLFSLAPSVIYGLLFAFAWKITDKSAIVYLLESAGGAFAGAIWTYWLAGNFSSFHIAAFLSIITFSSIDIVFSTKLRPITIILSLILLMSILVGDINKIDVKTRKIQWKGYNIIKEKESIYGYLNITKTGSLYSLFDNGLLYLNWPNEPADEEIIHWPLLVNDTPKKVLIIGGAATGGLAQLFKYKLDELDYLEMDHAVLELTNSSGGSFAYSMQTQDPAVTIKKLTTISGKDPRIWIKEANSQEYDVIIFNYSEPASSQTNRFYTLEFFNEAKKTLKNNGVFSLNLISSENYLNPSTKFLNASIYHTLKSVFSNIFIVPGDRLIFLAGNNGQISKIDSEFMIKNYKIKKISNVYVNEHYFPHKISKDRLSFIANELNKVENAKINSDFKPISYFYYILLWQAKFATPTYTIHIILLIIGIFWGLNRIRKKPPNAVSIYMACLGAVGITLEIVLLLAYQSIHGFVFQKIGLLFASFMLGLALGSWTFNNTKTSKKYLLILSLLIIGFSVSLPSFIPILSANTFFFVLCILGFLIGAAFPVSSKLKEANIVYAADLFGASIAGILTSIFLIPLLGFQITCYIAAVLMALAVSTLFLPFFFAK